MKKLIAELPTLTTLMEKEELIVYLAAAQEAASAVLMTEREAKQMPAHPIIVIMDQPIKQVLSKPKITGRMQKWSIELGEYDIQYKPQTSVKGKILADFIVERSKKDSLVTTMEVEEELSELWTLFTDGSSCVDGSGAGLILTSPEGTKFTYVMRFRFDATNNEAEYEALIAIKQVPRSENKKADALNKIASTNFAHLTKQVLVEEVSEKSIDEAKVLAVVVEEGDTWMNPIYNYLTEETLPAKKEKAKAIRRKSGRYAHACQNKICGSKGHTNMILLANNARGCKKNDKEMSRFQVHRPVLRNPQQKLTPIMSSWSFYKWGIDIAGPFPEGPGKVKFLIVAMDYFTKWIEAKPVATITAKVDMVQNDEALEINLDLLKERREQAAILEARSKGKMEKYYNSKVHNIRFKPEDLVYRNNDASHAKESEKLSPK
uniref:Reverse transcriptase domain-containing protein n=1 Tax=Tanacetum cinerariifolium TaxID=118510 RepID=A0A6L2L455_TANCI|nr:hypothetical protein [Tanacetum cinerariifolium]